MLGQSGFTLLPSWPWQAVQVNARAFPASIEPSTRLSAIVTAGASNIAAITASEAILMFMF